ncbi:MAG: dTDP-3-amino-3,6-dideoxy-alpha-D-galactopyranose 3-N-acetyltransferase [Syntrophorhabdaceae bacterium PtaU1.Bin034]|nr:MAG: dTDP-3-amino-3,6-dideoxy-alpha-D-galactopyranose 3-N-acetyltransferase [Syntrophorhabdaceae bacterium PtaU1.Bin034]
MIVEINGKRPRIDPKSFIVDSAMVIGDVVVEAGANIWFHSIVRGDTNYIHIGANCNVQDACVLHVVKNRYPLILEDNVVLGHRVVVHGCRIKKGSLIGIGATVLDGAVVGEESIIGSGSVVTPGSVIPPRSLALGTPARVVRSLREEDILMIRGMNNEYLELKEAYRQALP